ncbi:GNAT family N-acetyltransferase [Nibrella viscosa]|uniref:GNAT family N-acetyltransferase n=1 Tax=Nibrella viscosa TaxID=1084524 RepID=A0ABP8L0S3_9BACT
MQATIHTERLSLHLLQASDAEFIRKLVNTAGWLRFIGDRNVHSSEDAIAYIGNISAAQHLTYWVVRIKERDVSVGVITFIKRTYLEHFDIGFAFLPEYTGQGYAYEAAREILSLVSQQPEYATVLATTLPDNVSSIRLLTKLGLRFCRKIDVGSDQLHVYSNAI